MSFIFGQMLVKDGVIFQIVDSIYNENKGCFEYVLSDIGLGENIFVDSKILHEYRYLTPTMLVVNSDLRRKLIGNLKNAAELDFLIDRAIDKKSSSLRKKYKKKEMGFK